LAPTLLAASVGVPYAVTNGPDWNALSTTSVASYFTTDSKNTNAVASPSATLPSSPTGLPTLTQPESEASVFPVAVPLEGNPAISLAEVLRMDVTKEWVYRRWPRKSTGLADLNDFGIRVPLVSGTRITDLAGSLTYRFDPYGRVRRISFRGRTGDTTELVHLLVQKYQLRRQPTTITGTQLFQVRRGEDIISELRTQPAAILWSSSPHTSFDVELELQHPNGMPLPPKPAAVPPVEEKQASMTESSHPEEPAAGAKEDGNGVSTEASHTPKKSSFNFFPRSQLPPGQIEYLQRSRM